MTDSQTKQRPPHGGRLEDRVVCISLASVRLANAGQELDETPTGLISLALRLTAVAVKAVTPGPGAWHR